MSTHSRMVHQRARTHKHTPTQNDKHVPIWAHTDPCMHKCTVIPMHIRRLLQKATIKQDQSKLTLLWHLTFSHHCTWFSALQTEKHLVIIYNISVAKKNNKAARDFLLLKYIRRENWVSEPQQNFLCEIQWRNRKTKHANKGLVDLKQSSPKYIISVLSN